MRCSSVFFLFFILNVLPQLPLTSSDWSEYESQRTKQKNESNHNVLPPNKKRKKKKTKHWRRKSLFPLKSFTNWDPFQWNRMKSNRVCRRVMMIIVSNLIWKSILCFGDEQRAPIPNKLSSYPVQFLDSNDLVRSSWTLCVRPQPVYYSSTHWSFDTYIHDTRPIPQNKNQRDKNERTNGDREKKRKRQKQIAKSE